MKEFIFNRKDYKSYKDMYEDIAKKTNSINIKDYFDSSNYDYNPNILWDVLAFFCRTYKIPKPNANGFFPSFSRKFLSLKISFYAYSNRSRPV